MRLFVAFPVPQEPLLQLQKSLIMDGISLAHDFHCTLKFLGDVEDGKVGEIIECLRRVQGRGFTLRFEGVGAFPTGQYIRVVWAGLRPEEPVVELQRQVEDVFDGLFERGERFMPHVTLARAKFVEDREKLVWIVGSLEAPAVEFSVDAFYLMKSELQKEGARHRAVERFGLGQQKAIK